MSKVLVNSSGQVMKSNDGSKILKQNYNFGSKVLGQSDLNQYLSINVPESIILTDNAFSIVAWQQFPSGPSIATNQRGFYEVLDSENSGVNMRSNGETNSYCFLVNSGNTVEQLYTSSVNNAKEFNVFRQDSSGSEFLINSTSKTTSTYTPNGTIDLINILLTTQYATGGSDFNCAFWMLFSRKISDTEVTYMYNNGLGNEALIIKNNLYWFKFNQAELLDFSDEQDESDLRVGVRNYGSIVNGHAEFIGLPDGTLEEQLEYANENYFELW